MGIPHCSSSKAAVYIQLPVQQHAYTYKYIYVDKLPSAILVHANTAYRIPVLRYYSHANTAYRIPVFACEYGVNTNMSVDKHELRLA